MITCEQKLKNASYMRDYLKKNSQKINEDRRKRWAVLKTLKLAQSKKWRENNKLLKSKIDKEYQLKNRAKISENKRKYYLAHRKELIRKSNERTKLKRKIDPIYKLKSVLRSRIIVCLVQRKYKKSVTTEKLIGTTLNEVKIYLEKKFKSGMDWSNHGLWHIDHIVPLATAKTEEEVIKLFHFTNLQPLWAIDNLKKGSKTA